MHQAAPLGPLSTGRIEGYVLPVQRPLRLLPNDVLDDFADAFRQDTAPGFFWMLHLLVFLKQSLGCFPCISLGWMQTKVWTAVCIQLNRFGRTRVGKVSHEWGALQFGHLLPNQSRVEAMFCGLVKRGESAALRVCHTVVWPKWLHMRRLREIRIRLKLGVRAGRRCRFGSLCAEVAVPKCCVLLAVGKLLIVGRKRLKKVLRIHPIRGCIEHGYGLVVVHARGCKHGFELALLLFGRMQPNLNTSRVIRFAKSRFLLEVCGHSSLAFVRWKCGIIRAVGR